jgi:hypothetical protein
VSRYLGGLSGFARGVFKVLVIFALVRLAFGVVAIAFLADDSLAYSLRATAIVALAVAVGLSVALFVRSMGPIHEPD